MWNKISKNGISCLVSNASGLGVFTIPEGTASLVAWRIVKMLNWINDEFVRDAACHSSIFPPAPGKEHENEDFVVRNTSRVVSYVNLVCLLEHILERLYKETIDRLKIIDPTIAADDAALASRKAEVADCFTFRNKVGAHTAYGSPRGDNLAMEFHSLVTLLSSYYEPDSGADSFSLGRPQVHIAGQMPNTELPAIGLKLLHPKICLHIEQWTQMLIDPCLIAKKKLPLTIGDTEYRAS